MSLRLLRPLLFPTKIMIVSVTSPKNKMHSYRAKVIWLVKSNSATRIFFSINHLLSFTSFKQKVQLKESKHYFIDFIKRILNMLICSVWIKSSVKHE